MSGSPSIPSWQASDLAALAAQGKLSGVNPTALAVIDQEESGGHGGGINPEGYGGFFGLGQSSKYPGGTTTPALLRDTTPAGFDTQAQIAASAFNAYLGQTGGDPVNAEQVYQTGQPIGPKNPEGGGAKLMAQYLGSSPGAAGGGATTGTTSAAQAQLASSSPASAVTTGLLSALWPAGLSQLFIRAGLIFFGGVLIIVALIIVAHGASPSGRAAAASEAETKSATKENRAETEDEEHESSSPAPARAARAARAAPPQPATGAKVPRSRGGGAVSGSNLVKTGEEAAEVAA